MGTTQSRDRMGTTRSSDRMGTTQRGDRMETTQRGDRMGSTQIMDTGMQNAYDEWEKKLDDSNSTPMSLPLEFLKVITSDFSNESVLGEGGYGVVYKGLLRSGKIIAVKKLIQTRLKEEAFHNEVTYLMGIKHANIVRFIGYCAESKWEVVERTSGSRDYVRAEMANRLLCFEYVPNKSLDKHISDPSSGLEWNTRFKIIKSIFNGLNFLHEECRIVHLDLKPENILMDYSMTPKLADFGLSRIFGEQQSRLVTENRAGTRGYMAPEYIDRGVVSNKADIFSLGIIVIEIITGCRDYPYFHQDSPHSTATALQQFTEKVLGSWRNLFLSTETYKPMERYAQQVRQCITIALKCVDPSMEKRPTAKDIIQMLIAVDKMQILVRTLTSNTITLEVENSDTIKDVKAKIQHKECAMMNVKTKIKNKDGCPTSIFWCTFEGRKLDEDRTVADYNIKNGSTLHVRLHNAFDQDPALGLTGSVE